MAAAHTQVDFLWITRRFRTIAVFPINWERLDAGVFTSMLPATKHRSRTFATRATDVIFERKHCSRRRAFMNFGLLPNNYFFFLSAAESCEDDESRKCALLFTFHFIENTIWLHFDIGRHGADDIH